MSNRQFMLDEDKKENRQFQLIVDGVTILQDNGTNPRIRRMTTRQANEFMSVSESLPDYEVRVILNDKQPVFSLQSSYKLVFGGNPIEYKIIDIRTSNEQDLWVKLYLVKLA